MIRAEPVQDLAEAPFLCGPPCTLPTAMGGKGINMPWDSSTELSCRPLGPSFTKKCARAHQQQRSQDAQRRKKRRCVQLRCIKVYICFSGTLQIIQRNYTLQYTKIAMENGPIEDVFPIKTEKIQPAMLVYDRVYVSSSFSETKRHAPFSSRIC